MCWHFATGSKNEFDCILSDTVRHIFLLLFPEGKIPLLNLKAQKRNNRHAGLLFKNILRELTTTTSVSVERLSENGLKVTRELRPVLGDYQILLKQRGATIV